MTIIPGPALDPATIGKPDLTGLDLSKTAPRFVTIEERIYDFSLCRYCGGSGYISSAEKAHLPAVCLACGAVQCGTHDTCSLCYHGLLSIDPPVARRNGRVRKCGYAHCNNPAVASAPRVGLVCFDHLTKARHPKTRYTQGMTVAEAIEINYYRNRPRFIWLPYYVPPRWSGYIRDFVREMNIDMMGGDNHVSR